MNIEFIYDDKRICKKTILFIRSITLLFHFISLYIDFDRIEKNRIFIYYINTIFATFCAISNNLRYEYAHIKIYGQTFQSIHQFQEWKKKYKFIKTTYFLNLIEIIFHILFFFMTINQFTFINYQIIFYSISVIIIYFYTFLYFLELIILFIICCLFNISFIDRVFKNKSRSSSYILTNVDLDKECCICMDKNANNWVDVPCGHSFHGQCIIQWNLTSNTCPICRSVIMI